ncbi:MAG TPA: Ig-like domain-containing protein, partial [Blastocatellia bacterium]
MITLREKYDTHHNLAVIIVKLAAAVAIIFSIHANAQAAGTLIPAPTRVDMVYDIARDTVYITSGSSVLRYQIGSNSFLPPFQLGGNLYGIDLSPDGNTLIVADATRTETNVWVHVIDLQTGASRKALFPRAFLEGGTYSVAFGNDETVLITSTFEGSGWVPMRRYNPRTNGWSEIASVRQSSMVTSSSDGSVIGFEESNISDGAFGRYRLSDASLLRKSGYTDGTGWFNYEIGVNRNGTQYALPTYGGTFIYDGNLNRLTTVGQYAGPQPIGVVYHPAEDVVYFAWAGSTEVRAHNTNTFAQLAAYNFEYTFTHPGNWAFVHGRLKLSGDGSLLFATVDGGVRYLRLYSPLTANNQSVNVTENTPSPVTLTGGVGNGGAVAYSVVSGPSHGALSGAAPNLVYTPAADYGGTDSFTFKVSYGKASVLATVSISVRAVNAPPVGYDQTVATAEDTAKSLTLIGSDADLDPLTFSVVEGPSHGTLSGAAPNLTYTPAPNYYGADSFTFKV